MFSHSDQTSQWQAAIPNGTASTGWGGRVEDNLLSQYNANAGFTPVTSTSGCGLFCTGQQTFAATVPVGGASLLQGASTPSRLAAVQQLMTFDNGLKLVSAANANFNRGVGFSTTLTNALKTAKVNTVFPNTLIGLQLQTVAQIMSIRASLGIGRQIFFCQLGGFDTHGAQQPTQDPLLQQLSQAVAAFYTATQEVGTDTLTTTFTASEFGRTLQPNGSAGTDHAWGSHHFVIGTGSTVADPSAAARSGASSRHSRSAARTTPTSAGRWSRPLRSISIPQLWREWFGVTPANINSIFPYVANFPTANLGFLG